MKPMGINSRTKKKMCGSGYSTYPKFLHPTLYVFLQILKLEVNSRTKYILIYIDIIEAFNSTARYLDDLLNIDNSYFEQMVGQIYPTELQLNKANSSDTEAPFLDLNLSIANDIVSSKIYDKRDNFNF